MLMLKYCVTDYLNLKKCFPFRKLKNTIKLHALKLYKRCNLTNISLNRQLKTYHPILTLSVKKHKYDLAWNRLSQSLSPFNT